MFPVGDMQKAEVRELASALGLRTAAKPDSQDVCFITRANGREAFLADRVELHRGVVLDSDGPGGGRGGCGGDWSPSASGGA